MTQKRKKSSKWPSGCPINFEFSIDRIECKTCRQFEKCLNVFTKAYKLAKKV